MQQQQQAAFWEEKKWDLCEAVFFSETCVLERLLACTRLRIHGDGRWWGRNRHTGLGPKKNTRKKSRILAEYMYLDPRFIIN